MDLKPFYDTPGFFRRKRFVIERISYACSGYPLYYKDNLFGVGIHNIG